MIGGVRGYNTIRYGTSEEEGQDSAIEEVRMLLF